jgi:1-aminocyclopropane-1-carboxylate deaminase
MASAPSIPSCKPFRPVSVAPMEHQSTVQSTVQLPLEKLTCQLSGHDVDVIFLDAIQPHGNKYYKLKYNLTFARQQGCSTLASFGGAWSNHLHALAQVGAEQGFRTIGIVRGERPTRLSMTLLDAEAQGMHLHFISRGDYRRREDPAFLLALQRGFADCYWIPEGGTNQLAIQGVGEIVTEISRLSPTADLIVLPVATGGTLAGIVAALPAEQQVLGISVLKGTNTSPDATRPASSSGARQGLEADIEDLLTAITGASERKRNWSVEHRFHCGGYARCPAYLQEFILDWQAHHSIPLDPVYTGKLFFALSRMLQQAEIDPGVKIVALHTGGGQGRRGYAFLDGT